MRQTIKRVESDDGSFPELQEWACAMAHDETRYGHPRAIERIWGKILSYPTSIRKLRTFVRER